MGPELTESADKDKGFKQHEEQYDETGAGWNASQLHAIFSADMSAINMALFAGVEED